MHITIKFKTDQVPVTLRGRHLTAQVEQDFLVIRNFDDPLCAVPHLDVESVEYEGKAKGPKRKAVESTLSAVEFEPITMDYSKLEDVIRTTMLKVVADAQQVEDQSALVATYAERMKKLSNAVSEAITRASSSKLDADGHYANGLITASNIMLESTLDWLECYKRSSKPTKPSRSDVSEPECGTQEYVPHSD